MTNSKDPSLADAAILLNSLDADSARALLRTLSAEHAQRLAAAAEGLGPVDESRRRLVIERFLRSLSSLDDAADRTGDLDDAPSRSAERFADWIAQRSPEHLAAALESERPQLAALVLSQLPPERGGAMLRAMGEDSHAEILARLGALRNCAAETWELVQEELDHALRTRPRSTRRAVHDASKPSAAAPLGGASRATLGPASFPELAQLDDDALALVVRSALPQTMRVALLGAERTFAARAGRWLPTASPETEREIGPLPLSDIEAAQRRVVEVARRLAAEGAITVASRRHFTAAA